MTKMFGNLTSTDQLEQAEDRVGGGFEPLATDVYTATIKLAYVGKANSSNAQSITVHADVNGKEYRETIWFTNRNGENFFLDKQDKSKRHPLPGFTILDDMCLFATGASMVEQETEERVVKLYDFDAKKEVNKPVQCIVGLHDQTVSLAIQREIVDKEAKDASGNYAPTGETRTQNVIQKVLHPEDGRTVNEYRQEIEGPEFRDTWLAKNKGKDYNKAKGITAGGPGAAGSGRPDFAGGAAAAPKTNLFGKKG